MRCPVVLVVGAGQMGSGIAQVLAVSGRGVRLFDSVDGAAGRAKEAIGERLRRAVDKGRMTAGEMGAALGRIDLVDGPDMAGADLAIEAVVEDEEVKREAFALLSATAGPAAILATNTSSIPIARIAAAAARPERVVGMHFMNPVPVMELVEIVVGPDTDPTVADEVEALAGDLGKTPARSADRPGFISNRVLMPMINEAIRALGEGVGTREAIDAVMTLGMRHPMGPLRLADLIGLDTCLSIMRVLNEGLGGDGYRPAPLLEEMVAQGRRGRKAGAGFYEYDSS